MKQRKQRAQKGEPQRITKAVTHIRLLEVNAGKLAALDALAPVYLALCQQYVTLFTTSEAPDKLRAPLYPTSLSERWHRVAIMQAAGIARSWRSNRTAAYQQYQDDLERYQKRVADGTLAASAKGPQWREWNIPTLREPCIQANVNVVKLEPSQDSSFEYWLSISTLEKGKPIVVPVKLAAYHKAQLTDPKTQQVRKLTTSVQLNQRDGVWWLTLSYDEEVAVQTAPAAPVVAVDDVLQCIGPLLAVLLCLVPLRRRWSGASLFLGLGMLAYVVGQGLWSYYQLIVQQTPFPSYADLAFLADYPLLLLGVLLLSARPLARISLVRVGLDGVMMMIAIITFSWYFVLGPTLLQGGTSLLAEVVGTAYPFGDLVLLLCALILWARQEDPILRPGLLLLLLGLLILVLTDSVYDYLNLQNSFVIGGLIDPLWSLGFQCIGLAVLALRRAAKLPAAVSVRPSRSLWSTLLPYAFIPALGLLLLYTWLTPGHNALQPGVYVGAALLVGLVLVRQIVAMREMHTLYVNNDALTSANKQLETQAQQLEIQATHDALTGLPNRSLLWRRIELASRRDHDLAALLIVDLDRFKEVNDTFGHQLGDQLLRQVGERLCQSVDAAVTVSRLGGDEFAVFLPEADETTALQVVAQLNAALEEPFLIGDYPLQIEASTGIALSPAHGNDPGTLSQHADVAMYLAKQNPERCALYDASHDQYSPRRLALLGDLRKAIASSELRLYYQPIAELHTGLVKGVEALVRWQHPTEGFIAPDQFIPLAEQTGLITPLTHWVAEAAIRQCREWLDAGLELPMAVNLSMRNLRDASLPDAIADLLAQYRVPPRLLCCEITESAMMADAEHTLLVLNRLFALGVRIAIDDYGTGYASLSYLKRLPADELKIDRAFVQHLTIDQSDQAIVRSTVSMAHSLGIQVVAEGVEDQATWNLLASLKCDIAQGYYLSRPIPAPDLVRWLDARQEGAVHGLDERKEAVAL